MGESPEEVIDVLDSEIERMTPSYSQALLCGVLTDAELDVLRADLLEQEPQAQDVHRAIDSARPSAPPAAMPLGSGVFPSVARTLIDTIAERLLAGDFHGVIEAADELHLEEPTSAAAPRFAEFARNMLVRKEIEAMDIRHVPRVVATAQEIQAFPLDRRAGFVLSLIDGAASLEELLDMTGMSRSETLTVVHELTMRGVLAIRPPDSLSTTRRARPRAR
jgi:hypothetical protein